MISDMKITYDIRNLVKLFESEHLEAFVGVSKTSITAKMLQLQWCSEERAAGGACGLILSLQAFECHKAEFQQNAGALRVVSPVLR